MGENTHRNTKNYCLCLSTILSPWNDFFTGRTYAVDVYCSTCLEKNSQQQGTGRGSNSTHPNRLVSHRGYGTSPGGPAHGSGRTKSKDGTPFPGRHPPNESTNAERNYSSWPAMIATCPHPTPTRNLPRVPPPQKTPTLLRVSHVENPRCFGCAAERPGSCSFSETFYSETVEVFFGGGRVPGVYVAPV